MIDETAQAADLFFNGNGAAVGAGAFGTDVDDVGTVDELLTRLGEGGGGIKRAVVTKGVVVDVDDAHHQRLAGEGKLVMTGLQEHG